MVNPVAGFGVTFRTLFRKTQMKGKQTRMYPEQPAMVMPRFHGRHQLNRWPDGLEKCVGCELCAWACPADAIYVQGGDNTEDERYSPGERYGRVYQINYLRCILCGFCIEACPTRALTMLNEFEMADTSRESMIWEKDQLLAPLQPGMEAPPHPRRLGDDERTYFLGLPDTGLADTRMPEGHQDTHVDESEQREVGTPWIRAGSEVRKEMRKQFHPDYSMPSDPALGAGQDARALGGPTDTAFHSEATRDKGAER